MTHDVTISLSKGNFDTPVNIHGKEMGCTLIDLPPY